MINLSGEHEIGMACIDGELGLLVVLLRDEDIGRSRLGKEVGIRDSSGDLWRKTDPCPTKGVYETS